MIRYEDDCVECGLPCLGDSCKYRNVKHLYCDNCGEEVDTLYWVNGDQLCRECAIDTLMDELEEVKDE